MEKVTGKTPTKTKEENSNNTGNFSKWDVKTKIKEDKSPKKVIIDTFVSDDEEPNWSFLETAQSEQFKKDKDVPLKETQNKTSNNVFNKEAYEENSFWGMCEWTDSEDENDPLPKQG